MRRKPSGLALGAIDAVRAVQSHQLRVGHRAQASVSMVSTKRSCFGSPRMVRPVRCCRIAGRARGGIVEQQSLEPQGVAIENEIGRRVAALASAHGKSCRNPGSFRIEPEGQIDPLDDEVGRAVIGKMKDLAGIGAHEKDCP